ncbi:cation transporter [Salmonella enterica]|nr:cation transporter [Salmonella enterica]EHG1358365.1 cation transporter [Salmonella enterica]
MSYRGPARVLNIAAPLLSRFIIPAAYKLMWLRRYRRPTA